MMNLPYIGKPKKLMQAGGAVMIMLTAVCLEPYDMIDGVTAASIIHPTAVPVLQLTGTPAIINNTITAVKGQPVTVNFSGTDPNGYQAYIVMGIIQNQMLYPPGFTGNHLPKGATLKKGTDNTNAVFTWNPPASASGGAPLVIDFGVFNTYGNTNYNQQTISIKVNDITGPTFAPTMTTQDTVYVGVPVTFPVQVKPDADKDNVLITATNLPAGATLTSPAKNSKGIWIANLNWTPTLAELGQSNVTFTAQDANDSASTAVNFTTNFTVLNVTTPAFAASMPTQQKAVVNKTLTFHVIVNPDPHTNDVQISAEGLPSGASLSAPKLVKGQLISTLSWKPSKGQLNNSYAVTFVAVDNLAGAQADDFTTTFTVASK
ncbi:hypothetical protein KEF85_07520 [Methylomonas paludis]|uniref:Uncharacterized protein n=1 Tax=Methylomonas paludis TaxID=1173101 RepID=A0A975MQS8_9GAMM|nr:hypothetical protein [Methylomonas paludis]QWF72286.1 hypothetical protein KEF85_07520 [Methylomonas paludis]